MIDSKWRAPYQSFVIQPVLNGPAAQFTPASLTFLACLLGLFIPVCLSFHLSFLAICLLVLSGFCDTLDGSLARFQNTVTARGAALDITSDRLVEFAIILGLYLYAPETRALSSLVMLGASFVCVTSFLVVAIFETNQGVKSFHYSPGIIERVEAFIFFGLMMLAPQSFGWLSALYSILVFITAFIRIYQFCCIL